MKCKTDTTKYILKKKKKKIVCQNLEIIEMELTRGSLLVI